MSIRKFETLATNEIFYIDSDIIEDTVHSGTFKYKVSEGNPNIQYKTFRVVVESDNRNVTIWNKECFRTYEKALSARQELNAKLIERREQLRIA